MCTYLHYDSPPICICIQRASDRNLKYSPMEEKRSLSLHKQPWHFLNQIKIIVLSCQCSVSVHFLIGGREKSIAEGYIVNNQEYSKKPCPAALYAWLLPQDPPLDPGFIFHRFSSFVNGVFLTTEKKNTCEYRSDS